MPLIATNCPTYRDTKKTLSATFDGLSLVCSDRETAVIIGIHQISTISSIYACVTVAGTGMQRRSIIKMASLETRIKTGCDTHGKAVMSRYAERKMMSK